MKTTITYAWTAEDESLTFAEHAANRLRNFHQIPDQKDPPPEVRAYRRVVENGADFTAEDVETVAGWLETLANRAQRRMDQLARIPQENAEVYQQARLTLAEMETAQRAARHAAQRLRQTFAAATTARTPDDCDYFKWTAEIEVAECWVADGFDLTADRLHEMIQAEIGFSFSHEVKVRVIASPAPEAIRKTQGHRD